MESIDKQLLKDRVADVLAEQILSGSLLPGAQLAEADLAERLGVSRTTVRGALSILEGKGLVTAAPYKGCRVARLRPDDLRELYELRSLLEGYAIESVTRRGTPEDVSQLEAVYSDMQSYVAEGDRHALAQADFNFHRLLLVLTGNKRLLAAWSAVAAQFRWSLALLSDTLEDMGEIAGNHGTYLDLIRQGDPIAARSFMQQTCEEYGELVASRIELADA